ncbi:hypothetical protein CBR_g50423 [Chara braunii]|uniref:Auxin efflux carrier component n=1 Tax=Chara braunii TaxID=69332 RepID=A0A388M6W5_CHABU|nr:hypothetical protein CBR_g50423 [Chara braunii]|eukprot:GBG90245.1 hypothetical protein CBR_g50423 [Chara braunii]
MYKMNLVFLIGDTVAKAVFIVVLGLGVWAFTRKDTFAVQFGWWVTTIMLVTVPNTVIIGFPLMDAMYGSDAISLAAQIIIVQAVFWFPLCNVLCQICQALQKGGGGGGGGEEKLAAAAAAAAAVDCNYSTNFKKNALLPPRGTMGIMAGGAKGVTITGPEKARDDRHVDLQKGGSEMAGKKLVSSEAGLAGNTSDAGKCNLEEDSEVGAGKTLGSLGVVVAGAGKTSGVDWEGWGLDKRGESDDSEVGRRFEFENGSPSLMTGWNLETVHCQVISPAGPAAMAVQREASLKHLDLDGQNGVATADPDGSASYLQPAQNESKAMATADLEYNFFISNHREASMDDEHGSCPWACTQTEAQWNDLANTQTQSHSQSQSPSPSRTQSHQSRVADDETDSGVICNRGCVPGLLGGDRHHHHHHHHHHGERKNDERKNADNEKSFAKGDPALTSMVDVKVECPQLSEGSDSLQKSGGAPASHKSTEVATLNEQRLSSSEILQMLKVSGNACSRSPMMWSGVLGLTYGLLASRFGFGMPDALNKTLLMLSNMCLGLSMISLASIGLMSYLLGCRGYVLKVAFMQGALPQGVLTFVFASKFDVHSDIFSTGVCFGTLVSIPILLIYYVLLEVFF